MLKIKDDSFISVLAEEFWVFLVMESFLLFRSLFSYRRLHYWLPYLWMERFVYLTKEVFYLKGWVKLCYFNILN